MQNTGYLDIHGLHMYYEVHGEGEPLVMLHGEFATADMFASLVETFKPTRQVILFEQQAHGRTADIDRPLSFAQMADDTATAMEKLGVGQADILGYSGGGTVAMQLALRHPEKVRKLALASTVYDTNGYVPGLMEGLKNPSPDGFPPELREAYEQVAPHPENWAQLVYKSADMANNPQKADLLTLKDLDRISTPALVAIGDQDIILPSYAIAMAKQLNTELVTLPGDHASYVVYDTTAFSEALKTFLGEQ
jgi:pimeloyl-ACP methyl ester carboxylesterase